MKIKPLIWKKSIHSIETRDSAQVYEAVDYTEDGARYEILGPRELVYYVTRITTHEPDPEEAWDDGQNYHRLGDSNKLSLAKVIAQEHYERSVTKLINELAENI